MLAVYSYLLVLALIVLAFEVWMIVDAAKNPLLSAEAKAAWIVGMLLIHPFAAIAYYFLRPTNPS